MGAGNPLLRGWSDNDYQPETFFLDFSPSEKAIQEELEKIKNSNDNELINFSEHLLKMNSEELINHFTELNQENFIDDLENILDELKLEIKTGDKYIDELSAAFHGSAVVLIQTKNVLLCSTDDSECHHFGIGFIPTIKFDDIHINIIDEKVSNYQWYKNRNLNFDDVCLKQAKKQYKKELKSFKLEANLIFSKIKEYYPNITKRNGAWMSSTITKNQKI